MIRINKSGVKQYYVTVIARNGETLSTSETFNSKQAAWKNVEAQCIVFYTQMVNVTDLSIKEQVRRYEYNMIQEPKED